LVAGRVADDNRLAVAGLTPFTTVDFPNRLAAVVFCQGCPWRCGYCHNTHLQPRLGQSQRRWPEVLEWLATRRGLLDGVVFSGGEPLLQHGLPQALADVRQLGFAVGLHTAGIYPERLAAVLPALDWVGLDIKGPFEHYHQITRAGGADAARASLSLVLNAGIDHELRCTVDTDLIDADALSRLARQLATLGASRLVLQACRHEGQATAVSPALVDAAAQHLPQVDVRFA